LNCVVAPKELNYTKLTGCYSLNKSENQSHIIFVWQIPSWKTFKHGW